MIFESLAFRIEESAITHLSLLPVDYQPEIRIGPETCEISPHDPHAVERRRILPFLRIIVGCGAHRK